MAKKKWPPVCIGLAVEMPTRDYTHTHTHTNIHTHTNTNKYTHLYTHGHNTVTYIIV